jgi:hypothetical protein
MPMPTYIDACAFCRQPLHVTSESFLAVSACHPEPGQAEWVDGLLRIGSVTARLALGEPNIYLLHPRCVGIVKNEVGHQSYFNCARALQPILRKEPLRYASPYKQPTADYALVLRAIISGSPVNAPELQKELHECLEIVDILKHQLPIEIIVMILGYLPLELALMLGCLSYGVWEGNTQRLRHDPVASQLELAYQVLGYDKNILHTQQTRKIRLEPKMELHFKEFGGQWYLQHLCPSHANFTQEVATKGKILFDHNPNREPYIAVQANQFGITHIAFEMKEGRPQWISPNKARRLKFFQDTNSAKLYNLIVVISNVRKNACYNSVRY